MYKHWRLISSFVVVVGLLALFSTKLKSQIPPLFLVTSPVEGQQVFAGSPIQVVVQPAGGSTLTSIDVTSSVGAIYNQPAGVPINLVIPNDKLGPLSLNIFAQASNGTNAIVTRGVVVVTNQILAEIVVDPNLVRLVAPGTATGWETQKRLTILGRYVGGAERDILRATGTTISSLNNLVATVDGAGVVKAVAPGQTVISIRNGDVVGSARIQINVFELRADLDGDSDIDNTDLGILMRANNTAATGSGDPRDLNADGQINALDARILVTLCSRPGCAIK